MASLHAEYLTEAEAYELALPVLRKNFKSFGLKESPSRKSKKLTAPLFFGWWRTSKPGFRHAF